jgi:hypothetical protein
MRANQASRPAHRIGPQEGNGGMARGAAGCRAARRRQTSRPTDIDAARWRDCTRVYPSRLGLCAICSCARQRPGRREAMRDGVVRASAKCPFESAPPCPGPGSWPQRRSGSDLLYQCTLTNGGTASKAVGQGKKAGRVSSPTRRLVCSVRVRWPSAIGGPLDCARYLARSGRRRGLGHRRCGGR